MLTEVTVFVYSAGKLAAEYSTAPPEANPTTKWTVTDQLGSPRVLVNSLGEVVSRRDFMPFGEEITPDGTHRTAGLKYNFGDNIRQKFTGYQKDKETGLDFAEARMYENRHARFTAVDPLLASGKNANPQTFNRYVYVINNPLMFVDPDGLQVASWTGTVYTNGRGTFSPDAFVGEDNHVVTGRGIRFVDATDGYSYSYSEAGATLLGRTADLNARAARLMPDNTQLLVSFTGGPLGEAIGGLRDGAANFGKGALNSITDSLTGGSIRDRLGFENPLALERTSYETPKQAAYGYLAEGAFILWTTAATGGGAASGLSRASSLSVVPQSGARGVYGYRYMTQGEINAVQNTGLLRGGNAGETFFTKDVFKSTTSATERLALPTPATHRMEFQILNNPNLSRTGERVLSDFGRTGGGNQFSTFDPVRVRIINIQPLRP